MPKKLIAAIFLSMLPLAATAQVREDANSVVKATERFYKVKYSNDQVDRFVYVFTAHVTSYMRQDGESSSWKHPHDTRRCSYRVGSYIKRDGYYLTGGGKRVPLNDVHKVYGASSGVYRKNDILEQTLGSHSPCNDFIADFNDRKAKITESISRDFDTFMLTDIFKTSATEAETAIGGAELQEDQN